MTEENLRRSIRAIGLFYYFGSFLMVFATVSSLTLLGVGDGLSALSGRHWISFVLFFGLGAFYFMLGRGLRQFRRWSRFVTMVLCCIALGAIPLGTIIGGAFLYVLVIAKHLFPGAQPGKIKSPRIFRRNRS